jgi:hypothetical protein
MPSPEKRDSRNAADAYDGPKAAIRHETLSGSSPLLEVTILREFTLRTYLAPTVL